MKMMDWKGQRVLVTGHTGFKGAWLCEWLLQSGAEVAGYSLEPNTNPNLFKILSLHERTKSTIGDIRDLKKFSSVVENFKPTVVFHLAAQALVRRSYADPIDTYSTNVMGTVHCLEIVRKVPSIKAAVIVTSDKCYENKETNRAFLENDPMGGHDPYSNSKGCAELVTSAYRDSFLDKDKKMVASGRAGNVIGGGDWSEDRLIPDLIRGIVEQKPVMIRNPQSIRPWQHVLDPLSGYLTLAQYLLSSNGREYCSGWNFGPDENDATDVEKVANQICSLWGPHAKWSRDSANHPHEAQFLRLNCDKAAQQLKWKPTWNLNKALSQTVNWYKCYYSTPEKTAELTRQQIKEYSKG